MNDLTVDLVKWSMNIQKSRADLSAKNIALSGTVGAKTMRLDFMNQIALVKNAVHSRAGDRQLNALLHHRVKDVEVAAKSLFASVALDDEIAEISDANGKYSVLAEGVNRHFALMMLAVKRGV